MSCVNTALVTHDYDKQGTRLLAKTIQLLAKVSTYEQSLRI